MKLIFLDIDGVLNSRQSSAYYSRLPEELENEYTLCPIAISNLRHILEKHPDCHLVISSTWRKSRSLKTLKEIFDYYEISKEKVISKTPILDTLRGVEIHKWLQESKIKPTHFVILDDDKDMDRYLDTIHFIHVDNRIGFSWKEVDKILKYFGGYYLKYEDLVVGQKYQLYSKPSSTGYTFTGNGFYYEDDSGKHDNIHFYPETECFALINQ